MISTSDDIILVPPPLFQQFLREKKGDNLRNNKIQKLFLFKVSIKNMCFNIFVSSKQQKYVIYIDFIFFHKSLIKFKSKQINKKNILFIKEQKKKQKKNLTYQRAKKKTSSLGFLMLSIQKKKKVSNG